MELAVDVSGGDGENGQDGFRDYDVYASYKLNDSSRGIKDHSKIFVGNNDSYNLIESSEDGFWSMATVFNVTVHSLTCCSNVSPGSGGAGGRPARLVINEKVKATSNIMQNTGQRGSNGANRGRCN